MYVIFQTRLDYVFYCLDVIIYVQLGFVIFMVKTVLNLSCLEILLFQFHMIFTIAINMNARN